MEDVEVKFSPSPMKYQKIAIAAQVFLRLLTVATTLVAACLMITNKQTIEFAGFAIDARYSYSSATKFFVYANIITCVISLLSFLCLIFAACRQGMNPSQYFCFFLLDLLMMSLVLAGCAAATAIGLVGKYGNNHTGWMAICDRFATYCNKSTTSIMFGYISLVFLMILTIMSANKSRQIQV